MQGGPLAVNESNDIIPIINNIKKKYNFINIFTQDAHPDNHISFAKNHKNAKEFTNVTLTDGTIQELWPVHCLINTFGFDIHKDIYIDKNTDLFFYKG